jgi:NADH/F420H2 dehydrogenase subunit C
MSDDAREADHEEADAAPVIDDDVAAVLCATFDGVFQRSLGQPVVYLDRAQLAAATQHLRDHERFTMCLDVTAVDHLTNGARTLPDGVVPERYEVVVSLLSHARNHRIRLIAQVPADDPTVPSVTPVFAGANFGEREVYDLFGIEFSGHPELVRILMPDDWQGHPLRKDFGAARVPVTFKGDPSPR